MRLLFDQNLSFRLCGLLSDLFPASTQVRLLGLDQASDREIWDYARANGYTIVSQDADYADMCALHGSPPKVVWLRCGNQATFVVERLLRDHVADIKALEHSSDASCLEVS